MRKIFLALLAVALLSSTMQLWSEDKSSTEKMLGTKERATWQAWKDRDAKGLGSVMTDDAINIAGGSMDKGKDKIVAEVKGCEVKGFSLSDISYTWLDKDTVILTYNATQDATCGGSKVPEKVIATSIWQKKGGQWVTPFHQETPAAGGM